jgi:hypothetical protein
VGMTGFWLNRGDSGRPDETPTVKTLLDLGMRIESHNETRTERNEGATLLRALGVGTSGSSATF